MDDIMYEDSRKLYGLKLYLEEFSKINTKEVMEVHLWDEYLMFAYLFGIADKVAKQLKDMYPEIIEQDINELLNSSIDSYIKSKIRRAMLSSKVSEQNSRMKAMDSSTKNDNDIIKFLAMKYNRIRQGMITQEISEIVGGAEAQK